MFKTTSVRITIVSSLIVTALVLAMAFTASGTQGEAYIVTLHFSTDFNNAGSYGNSAREAYQEFTNTGDSFKIETPYGGDARRVVLAARLEGDYFYSANGIYLSEKDSLAPWEPCCGSLQVWLNFPDSNNSDMYYPGNTTGLYIRAVQIGFRNYGSYFAGGLHKMHGGTVNWNHWISFSGEGVITVDLLTGHYSYGELHAINANPEAELLGVDGFAIQSCKSNKIRIAWVKIYVYQNIR